MDTSKLSLGDQIAAVSGIALLIFMFLPWYGVDANAGAVTISESANAWETLSFIDILLFLIALVAIGVPVAKATDSLPADVPGAVLVAGAGALGVLLILFRIVDLPTPDLNVPGIDFGRKLGIFLGLIAAGGITYGGWRAMEETPVTSTPATPPPPPAPEPPAATS